VQELSCYYGVNSIVASCVHHRICRNLWWRTDDRPTEKKRKI